ncbi:MAG: hypothetical protein K0S06_2212 [Microvirga sp.]|nr:hypothetical protein [Microvirga sp.]
MGRVGADRRAVEPRGERRARIGAPLRAVGVQHVRLQGAVDAGEAQERGGVERVRVAAHRNAGDAELETRPKLGERLGGTLAAGRGIAEDADLQPARDLRPRHVDDVAEEPADRRAEDVQDAQPTARVRDVGGRERDRAGMRLGVQNQRSLITIVSPGRTG